MSRFIDQQRDTDRLRQRQDEGDRARRRDLNADLRIEGARRLFLRSPNGTYFQLSVDDAGELSAINVGSDPK